jgi:phasin family protein
MPDDPKSAATADAATYMSLLASNPLAFARWFQGMFAVAQEITQFTHARLEESMSAWSTFASCASPEQALDYQRRFAAKAAEQYAEHIAKLSQMMMSVAGDNLSTVQPQAARKR